MASVSRATARSFPDRGEAFDERGVITDFAAAGLRLPSPGMRSNATAQWVVLVERFVAGLDLGRLAEIADRTDERLLGAIAIPDDETCFLLFAASGDPVSDADRGDRAVAALLAGPWLPTRPERNS
jgi:hypothetical protein